MNTVDQLNLRVTVQSVVTGARATVLIMMFIATDPPTLATSLVVEAERSRPLLGEACVRADALVRARKVEANKTRSMSYAPADAVHRQLTTYRDLIPPSIPHSPRAPLSWILMAG